MLKISGSLVVVDYKRVFPTTNKNVMELRIIHNNLNRPISYPSICQMILLKILTPLKTNMEPEDTPMEKEKHRPKPPFVGFHVGFRGCNTWLNHQATGSRWTFEVGSASHVRRSWGSQRGCHTGMLVNNYRSGANKYMDTLYGREDPCMVYLPTLPTLLWG